MKSLKDFYKINEKKQRIRGGKDTATIAELAQCYACAIASNVLKSNITEDDINDDTIDMARQYVKSQNRKPVINLLTPEWKSIVVSIANTLHGRGYFIPGGIYHRNDIFMQQIYANAREAMKNSGQKYLNDDRWNPADIWIASPTLRLKSAPTGSIEQYNQWIKDKFESKELIGISLKKTLKPKVKIFNVDDFITPIFYKGFSYKEGTLDRDDAFFGNKHFYAFGKETKQIKMQGRTFESKKFTAYAMEIMGNKAAQGKVGWTIIRKFIEDNTGNTALPDYKHVANLATNNVDKLIEMIFSLFNKYATKDWTLEEFSSKLDKNPYRLFSQYFNLLIIDVLESNTGDVSDELFEDIYNHAASRVENSSVFIKIS